MKYVLSAWAELKRGFEVLALGEMCFLRAWGQLQRGFEVLALGEICFEGMGGVEKGVVFFWKPIQSETVLSYNTG